MEKQYIVVYPKQKAIIVTSNKVLLGVSKSIRPVILERQGDEALVALKHKGKDGHVKTAGKLYGSVLMIGDFFNAGAFRIVKLIYQLASGKMKGDKPFIIDPDQSELVERVK